MATEARPEQAERIWAGEDDLAQAGMFAAVAHELQSPLAAIHGYAQLILQVAGSEASNPLIVRAAEAILQQASRGRRLVGGLLDAGSSAELAPRLRRRRVELGELLRRVADEQQRSAERHRLHLDLAAQAIHAYIDADLVEQAFANLISNACKYSPDGGTVLVRLRPQALEGQEGRECWAAISVTDNGLGIAPEEQALIFERFYRSRNPAVRAVGGLGLGLYLSQAIVASHGGKLLVQSALRQGSTFTIFLPLE
jgi:signal transduction histidine kinase